jgi:hypothetical protein
MLGIIGTTIVTAPKVADCEFVESQHVKHTDLTHCSTEQRRSLRDTCSHKQAAIGTTTNRQSTNNNTSSSMMSTSELQHTHTQ